MKQRKNKKYTFKTVFELYNYKEEKGNSTNGVKNTNCSNCQMSWATYIARASKAKLRENTLEYHTPSH